MRWTILAIVTLILLFTANIASSGAAQARDLTRSQAVDGIDRAREG